MVIRSQWGFLQPTASNFMVENSYPVKMEDCSTLQIQYFLPKLW